MLDIKPVKPKFSATRSYGNNRYIVYSPKLGREVILYSNLEYYCFLILEFDSNVSFYCEQPDLHIARFINQKSKKSVVDFIKEDKNGITIIECKHGSDLEKTKVIEQIQVQKEWAILKQYSYEIFTEKTIQDKQTMLANFKKLHTALLQYSIDEQATKNGVIILLKELGTLSIKKLIACCPNTSEKNILPILSFLYHTGKISIEITKSELNLETEVSCCER